MNTNRMEKLERKVRRQQTLNWILVIIVLGATGFGFTQPEPEMLVTRRLLIVDENGIPRIILAAGDDVAGEGATIHFFDEKMEERMSTGIAGEGIGSSIYDQEGNLRFGMGVNDTMGAGMTLYGENQIMVDLTFNYELDEDPVLYLERGAISGPSRMSMFNDEEERRIVLDADDFDGNAGLHFIHEDDFSVLSLGHRFDGTTGISIYDESDALRWRATTLEDHFEMVMYGRDCSERIVNAVSDGGDAYLAITDRAEEFDIVMGSIENHVLFSVEGREDGTLVTELPEIEDAETVKAKDITAEETSHEQ